ncbi:MAG: carbohydrate ABC transporter permease [Brevinematia bacterium]
MPAVAIFSIWKFVGNNFLYYLIGLQNIPTSCYEAALIDGATPLQIFRYIILPLLTPTIFFVSTILLIGTMQIFDEPYLITKGGPGDSSRTIALYIYEKAFRYYDMGYGSAIASILFILLLILTILQFVMQKKWVIYEYE